VNKRCALITGSNGGIGRELCSSFREAGWHVVGSDSEPATGSWSDTHVVMDLARFCQDAVYRSDRLAALKAECPADGLGVLVNNAALQIVKPVESLTVEDWTSTLNVNLLAPFLLTQSLLQELEVAAGSVINISSIHTTQTKPEFVAYATSKAALSGLTRSLAVELGGRVRVNAICPAAIKTPMLIAGFSGKPEGLEALGDIHPVGRIGAPKEVAALALYLASDAAGFMTGADIQLDGGVSKRLRDPL
jgi:NAD(P)-dependent dehydrogenase (short-subunit alcohol dehydrogenase family)